MQFPVGLYEENYGLNNLNYAIGLFQLFVYMYMTTVREPDVYMFESEKTFLNPKTKEKVKFASVFEKSSVNLSVVVPAYNEEQRSKYTTVGPEIWFTT